MFLSLLFCGHISCNFKCGVSHASRNHSVSSQCFLLLCFPFQLLVFIFAWGFIVFIFASGFYSFCICFMVLQFSYLLLGFLLLQFYSFHIFFRILQFLYLFQGFIVLQFLYLFQGFLVFVIASSIYSYNICFRALQFTTSGFSFCLSGFSSFQSSPIIPSCTK